MYYGMVWREEAPYEGGSTEATQIMYMQAWEILVDT
jgi:hypothetical protein